VSLARPIGASGTALIDSVAPFPEMDVKDDPISLIATIFAKMLAPLLRVQGAANNVVKGIVQVFELKIAELEPSQ
jgi:hypothetical protein